MPSIGDMSYGFDADGVEVYIDNIKAIVLTKAAEAIKNTEKIETCCRDHWEGKARDNFLTNLETATEHVSEQFDALYKILEGEINSAHAAMSNKDQELIKPNY